MSWERPLWVFGGSESYAFMTCQVSMSLVSSLVHEVVQKDGVRYGGFLNSAERCPGCEWLVVLACAVVCESRNTCVRLNRNISWPSFTYDPHNSRPTTPRHPIQQQ